MKMISIAILTLVLTGGCATTTMQTLDVSSRSRAYEADFTATFRAVVAYCTDHGFAVTMADRELGIINTDYKMTDPGSISTVLTGNGRAKLNFTVQRITDKTTKVIALASLEQQGAFGTWKQASGNESQAKKQYDTILGNIGTYITQ